MVMSGACFGRSPYSFYQCRESDITAEGTTFNVFSYDAVWAENLTHHLPYAEDLKESLQQKEKARQTEAHYKTFK